MITSEEIEAAKDYFAADPHPKACAEWELAKAKTQLARRRAEIIRGVNDKLTVARLEALIELDEEYMSFRDALDDAEFELHREKARWEKATTVKEMWRTEQATARKLDELVR